MLANDASRVIQLMVRLRVNHAETERLTTDLFDVPQNEALPNATLILDANRDDVQAWINIHSTASPGPSAVRAHFAPGSSGGGGARSRSQPPCLCLLRLAALSRWLASPASILPMPR